MHIQSNTPGNKGPVRTRHAEPHPIIIRRIMEVHGVSASLARTVAILAGLGVR
jgi:hypothetical protein